MQKKYTVNGGCVLCLMCVYECPVGAISIKENETTVIDKEKCLGCGKCYKNCQTGAIVELEEK